MPLDSETKAFADKQCQQVKGIRPTVIRSSYRHR